MTDRFLTFIKDYYRNNSYLILLSVAFLLLALFIFYQITDEIILENETVFDEFIFMIFAKFIVREHLDKSVIIITDFSAPHFMMYLFPGLVALLFLFRQKQKAFFLLLTGTGGIFLFSSFKYIFARVRPPYPLLHPEEGFSFPSGHATFSFVFYGAMAYLVWLSSLPKIIKVGMMIFLITLSILIGISRIYLRVHYPSDVLAGFCLGYSWLLMMIYTYRRWRPLI